MSLYQVGLDVNGDRNVSKHTAQAVSQVVGGNGHVELVDSGRHTVDGRWTLWMIDMPKPFNGSVKIGSGIRINVETPMP